MRLRSAIVLSCTAGALILGCARRRSDAINQEPPPPPVTLTVSNNNWADVILYVIRGGQRIRVLTVVSTNSASVVLPRNLVGPAGEVRILALAIGGNARYLSPTVYASPGGTVEVNLETTLRRSTVVTW